jgi:hypothetical protein
VIGRGKRSKGVTRIISHSSWLAIQLAIEVIRFIKNQRGTKEGDQVVGWWDGWW